MSFAGYLLDEHVDWGLIEAIRATEPGIDVHAVGLGDAPRRGTPDPELLTWLEDRDFAHVPLR